MKIYSINNFNTYAVKNSKIRQSNGFLFLKNQALADIVSFSAKKYDSDTIINPTYHCAYCGCKVYTESQLDSIAKEMLISKYDRLEGKIKSVIEKLEGAKHSQEMALAKRLENQEQIDFFKNFLDIASKKAYLKGDAIFEQVYNLDKDQALELLLKNLHPLLKTIDHISPQNEELDNNNSDINLVESCYTCNHDLKKGSSFGEFYTMFPSIKNNMPPDKFQYASNKLLELSQSNVIRRLSASNMLKMVQRLLLQKSEAENYLYSVNMRIKGSAEQIKSTIEDCQAEIESKKSELSTLNKKLDDLLKDPEYSAMLKRLSLESKMDNEKNILSSLRDKKQHISNSINELNNPKPSKKKLEEMTDDEKKAKIAALKNQLFSLNSSIDVHEEAQLSLKIEIEQLNSQFPTIDMLQRQKTDLESLLSKMQKLDSYDSLIQEKNHNIAMLNNQISHIQDELSNVPDKIISPEDCSDIELSQFDKYKDLMEALRYIDEHPNGGNIRILVHQSAKSNIESQIASLSHNPLVIQYQRNEKISALNKKLLDLKKQKEDIEKQLSSLLNEQSYLKKECLAMSKDKVQQKLSDTVSAIRRLNDKSNNLKISQRISSINAEIILLNQTINDLNNKLKEIESSYKSEA